MSVGLCVRLVTRRMIIAAMMIMMVMEMEITMMMMMLVTKSIKQNNTAMSKSATI